jgi:hypothetical protein
MGRPGAIRGVSAGNAAAPAAAAAAGERISPALPRMLGRPASVRFGGLTSMILRLAGRGPDSDGNNWGTREYRAYRAGRSVGLRRDSPSRINQGQWQPD